MTENKDDFIKKILIIMFSFLFVFVIVMIGIFLIMGETPDVLITAVFAACVGEYSICGLIKNRKEKEKTIRMLNMSEEDDDEVIICDDNNDEVAGNIRAGDIEEEPID